MIDIKADHQLTRTWARSRLRDNSYFISISISISIYMCVYVCVYIYMYIYIYNYFCCFLLSVLCIEERYRLFFFFCVWRFPRVRKVKALQTISTTSVECQTGLRNSALIWTRNSMDWLPLDSETLLCLRWTTDVSGSDFQRPARK